MRKLYIHTGLAKTGTTMLQEVVFPHTSFFYLGKTNGLKEGWATAQDPFTLFKFLQNNCEGESLEIMLQNKILKNHYEYYQNAIGLKDNLLMSDEGFSSNPLRWHMHFILDSCRIIVSKSNDFDASFFQGGLLADRFAASGDESILRMKRSFMKKNTIALKIQRCLEALDAELGRVLFVDRDFGSWFVSYFLQYISDKESSHEFSSWNVGPALMFAAAGFVIRWEELLENSGRPGYVLVPSFSKCIARDFGLDKIDIVNYSSNQSEFSSRLKPVLSNYGINAAVCNKICDASLRKNITGLKNFQSAGGREILLLRKQFARILSNLVERR